MKDEINKLKLLADKFLNRNYALTQEIEIYKELEIPKEPVLKEIEGWDFKDYICPTCNAKSSVFNLKRCQCGQVLDWSKVPHEPQWGDKFVSNELIHLMAESLYNILYSIRCDFDQEDELKQRKKAAIILTKSLYKLTKDKMFKELLHELKHFRPGHDDGRVFRDIDANYDAIRLKYRINHLKYWNYKK